METDKEKEQKEKERKELVKKLWKYLYWSVINFGRVFVNLWRAIKVFYKLFERYILIALLVVLSVLYAITYMEYKNERDGLSKKSVCDSERIYRLQNDSIALHNFSKNNGYRKPDTVKLVKKVVVYKQAKRDTI